MSNTHINVVPRKRAATRVPRKKAATTRDVQRDAIMKMIFSRAGFAAEVARHLDVTHQNVSGWNRVPPHHVVSIAELLGMTPAQVRPDIFGRRRK